MNKVERLKIPSALDSHNRLWTKIFVASCVIGVSMDPLFLYIPVINKKQKCLAVDEHVKYVFLVLRSVTDLFYVFYIFYRHRNAVAIANSYNLSRSVFTGFPWSYQLLIDVSAIIPLPQLIVLRYFSVLAGSRNLVGRKVLNMLLILQYIPRFLRIFISSKELRKSFDSIMTRRVWVWGLFFFVLYIICGHIFGAFWYFYAIFSETYCWHSACKNLRGCEPRTFDCRMSTHPIKNMTYLNEFCPIDPPNPTVYNFGIFSDAIESNILTKSIFLQKVARCFWWGLRNLSSFGQNLDTSSSMTDNLFAAFVSLLGLLLFLYLIGTIQTYMQLATTKEEKARMKIDNKLTETFWSNFNLPDHKKKVILLYLHRAIKEDKDVDMEHLFSLIDQENAVPQDNTKNFAKQNFAALVTKILGETNTSHLNAELWISKNGFSVDIKNHIMRYVRLRFHEGKEVDVTNIISILPHELALSLKKLLCVETLKKVPMLKNMDEYVYETICKYIKPVVYAEKSYIIRKDEPIDFILLLTHGIALSFGSNTNPMKRIQRGDFFGEELLEWQLNSSSYDRFPMSEVNLKCQTKVEAFVLMAPDLEHVLSICWTNFSDKSKPILEGLKPFAAKSLQQRFQRFKQNNRKEKDRDDKISVITE